MAALRKSFAVLAGALLLTALVFVAREVYAATKNYSGRIMDTSYASTAVITSDYLVADGNTDRMTLLVYSTQAGSLQAKYRSPFGGEEVNIDTATAITAAELEVVILNFGVPNVFVTFTPSAATAGEIWIDGVAGTGPRRNGG